MTEVESKRLTPNGENSVGNLTLDHLLKLKTENRRVMKDSAFNHRAVLTGLWSHKLPCGKIAEFQQYDEFIDLYGIKEGDGMYLAPEDRVTVW